MTCIRKALMPQCLATNRCLSQDTFIPCLLVIQPWYGDELDPLEFGWGIGASKLLPIDSGVVVAPEQLSKLMYCEIYVMNLQLIGAKDKSPARMSVCSHCVVLTSTNVFFSYSIDNDGN